MKKLSSIMLVFVLSFSFLTSLVCAKDLPQESTYSIVETSESSQLFVNFINDSFSNLNKIHIADSHEVDVTNNYISRFKTYYAAKNYKSIQQLIERNNLSVSYKTKKVASLNSILKAGATRTEYFNESFYHRETERNKNKYTKEWVTKLTARVTYEPNSGKIVSVTSPQITLETANFGGQFSPGMRNIRTDKSISGSTVTFIGSYKMVADLSIPIGDIPLPYTFDFGTHRDSFSETISF